MHSKVGFFSAVLAGALVFCASTPAKAIMLTVSAPVDSSSNSGVLGNGVASSATTLSDSGGSSADFISAAVNGATRYAFGAAADNGANSGADTVTRNSNYSISFTVNAPLGNVYEVKINTSMLGGLTVVDDYAIGNGTSGIASITNVAGNLDGNATAGLGLATAASQNGSSGTSETAVNQANVHTISGLQGGNSYTLNFTWSSTANSQANSSVLDNTDEVGIRFGIGNVQGSNAADDYAGSPARTQANDGHFVTITATVTAVPEPSTLALAALGMVGVGLAAWRKRRAA